MDSTQTIPQTAEAISRYGIDLTSQIRKTLPLVKSQGEPTNTSCLVGTSENEVKGGEGGRIPPESISEHVR
ncbi:hypothetical protein DPMN_164485 [Dreissena polymorpha]|uniref:Uncharacterized protein n=1 Tax=Dreissena polymorpha TaxID=45954 RepID=A0A9D4IW54_DREPO|nr:hypothetical protein DPMN_164485 [Dreissena polymorpha]